MNDKSMNQRFDDVMKAQGFKPPPMVRFVKTDPRGAEYGRYEAVFDSTMQLLRVIHTGRNDSPESDYSMLFDDPTDFLNWAMSNA